MKKLELIVAAILAIFLGGGIILVLNGSPGSNKNDSQEFINLPTAAPNKGVVKTLIPTTSSKNSAGSKEISNTATPTLPLTKAGNEKSADIEDLLLLFSSEYSGPFDFNYCKIAEFYGLLCKKIDLDNTEITEGLLRDGLGNYYKLIGLDANILQQKPGLLTENEMSLLKTAVSTGGANMIISNLSEQSGGSSLTELTDGAILKVTVPKDSHRDWNISTVAPEITREFTGQVITSTTSASQIDFGLSLDPMTPVTPLFSSKDDSGATYLIFAKLPKGAGSIFLNAGATGWSLDTLSMSEIVYNPSHFSEIMPLMLTMRYALEEETWHNDHNFANLTLDGLNLTEPFQNVNYTGLLKEMKAHNFHTTIAFSPVNWEKSKLEVTNLFVKNPDRYSLAQYGNNTDGYEFYKYSVSLDDPYPARPLVDQEWDILEGLSRMEMLTKYTGIPFDRVMVFPIGISPEETLVLLKKNNYLATVNIQNIPLGVTPSLNWDEGVVPVSLDYGNFPILTRRLLGAYQTRPILQSFYFDLFFEKPALIGSNASGKGLFATGIDSFDPIADQLNAIPGGLEWLSLGDIIKHTYLEKVNDDGSVDVRMFTNDLILTNNISYQRTYYVMKEETLNVPIVNLTVNDHEVPFRIEDGFLSLDIVLPARTSVEIFIRYKDQ